MNTNKTQAEQLPQDAVMQSVLINELRINNYYELKGSVLGGGICQLKNLNDFIHIGNLIESDLVKPIPLTEEWLLKFGFEFKKIIKYKKSYTPEHYKLNNFSLTISNNGYYVVSDVPIYIFFVHQLQNLYFDLTGSELTVA